MFDNALGLIELNSISRGILTCDVVVKKANIVFLSAGAVCPGKYMLAFYGAVADVEEAVKAIKKIPKISRRACRQRVEKKFSLEIMVENYEKVYNEIFNREEKKSQ